MTPRFARSARSSIPVAICLSATLLLLLSGTGRADKRDRPKQKGKTWTWNFAADTLGLAPTGSRVHGGTWAVELDSSRATASAVAPTDSTGVTDSVLVGPRFLRQSEAEDGITYHYLQFPKPHIQDFEASVRFRIRAGDIDPTAGIAFHLDPKGRNGYVVRVSGASGEIVAHYMLYGKRRDLRAAAIDPPGPGAWHTLGVRKQGAVLEVTYDGASIFRMRDERFSEGNVGLWTEDDTVVDFSDLIVRSL